eukprot:TRINITY_DN645_c0_g2_i1.p1 TRINITY_DN645_c0_g2~~TRINITY_DN645_c0_g2_i1.p1  ORF type:complete len:291 (+),score=60.93 TRINITY_DN645_c0_g2_i1:50-922(+)
MSEKLSLKSRKLPTQEERDARKLTERSELPAKEGEILPFKKVEFKQFISTMQDMGPEWVKAYDKDNTTVWTQKSKELAVNSVRVKALFNSVDMETFWNVLHDHKYRAAWDENMVDGYTVEVLNKTNEVGYYAAKFPSGLSSRDFCNKRGWQWRGKKGYCVVMNESVVHPACPEFKGFVRAWSYRTGYLIKKVDKGVEFFYYTCSDPRGLIPGWVVNWVTTKYAPKLIEKLYSAVLNYKDWKSNDESKDHYPWLDRKQDDPEKKMTPEELKKTLQVRSKEVYTPSPTLLKK